MNTIQDLTDGDIFQFDFLVVGPPRSGTAWMANFLSYGDKSFCWHEPFAPNKSFHSNENPKRIVGASCNSFPVTHMGQLKRVDFPMVYLSRDFDKCVEALACKLGDISNALLYYKNNYRDASNLTDVKFNIKSEKDMSLEGLKIVWNTCMMGKIPFDKMWAEKCLLNNVQLRSLDYNN